MSELNIKMEMSSSNGTSCTLHFTKTAGKGTLTASADGVSKTVTITARQLDDDTNIYGYKYTWTIS